MVSTTASAVKQKDRVKILRKGDFCFLLGFYPVRSRGFADIL